MTAAAFHLDVENQATLGVWWFDEELRHFYGAEKDTEFAAVASMFKLGVMNHPDTPQKGHRSELANDLHACSVYRNCWSGPNWTSSRSIDPEPGYRDE